MAACPDRRAGGRQRRVLRQRDGVAVVARRATATAGTRLGRRAGTGPTGPRPSHRRQPHRARPQEEAMSSTRRPATGSVLGEAVTKARTAPDLAVTGEVI